MKMLIATGAAALLLAGSALPASADAHEATVQAWNLDRLKVADRDTDRDYDHADRYDPYDEDDAYDAYRPAYPSDHYGVGYGVYYRDALRQREGRHGGLIYGPNAYENRKIGPGMRGR